MAFFFWRTSSSGTVIPEARRDVGIAVPRSSDPALILIWTLTDPMGIAKIVCRPYRARAYETRARLLVIGVLRARPCAAIPSHYTRQKHFLFSFSFSIHGMARMLEHEGFWLPCWMLGDFCFVIGNGTSIASRQEAHYEDLTSCRMHADMAVRSVKKCCPRKTNSQRARMGI